MKCLMQPSLCSVDGSCVGDSFVDVIDTSMDVIDGPNTACVGVFTCFQNNKET